MANPSDVHSRLEWLKRQRDVLDAEISRLEIRLRNTDSGSKMLHGWVEGRGDRLDWGFPQPNFAALNLDDYVNAGNCVVHMYNSALGEEKFKADVDLGLYAGGSTPEEAFQLLTRRLDAVVSRIKEE